MAAAVDATAEAAVTQEIAVEPGTNQRGTDTKDASPGGALEARAPDPTASEPARRGADDAATTAPQSRGDRAPHHEAGDEGSPASTPAERDPVEEAFVALDASTRALVVLYHLDGLSPRRVAELTGMTAPEARRRIDAGADRIGRAAGIVVAPAVVDDALAEVEVTIDAGP